MENLNKNLLFVVFIEFIALFITKFPFWTYTVTVVNIIAIVFLIKYKPKNYIYSVIGLSLLFILPMIFVLYMISKIQC
jgi:hypothetical protein